MDGKTKLVVPAALVVVVLGAGCTTSPTPPPADAGTTDTGAVADARSPDANCAAFEEYDPVANMCLPVV